MTGGLANLSQYLLPAGLGIGGLYGGYKYNQHMEDKNRKTPETYVPFVADEPGEVSFYNKAIENINKAPYGHKTANPMYHLGKGLREFVAKPLIRPAADTLRQGNPLSGAALGGLAGAPIGLILGLIRNGFSGALPGLLKGLAVGALGGGGLSALGNYSANRTSGMEKDFVNPINKYSEYFKDKSNFAVKSSFEKKAYMGYSEGPSVNMSNIYTSGVSQAQKSAIAAEMRSLSPREKSTLQRLLQGAAGSAAIFIIAKYLLKLGRRPTLMSMILGGLGGYNYR